jgi:hypothetical protein
MGANFAYSSEQLVVIQTTSNNQKSFVLQLGLQNGIAKRQEAIFSNDNVSIVCKAIEVNREYSLWVPVDKNINVPFKRTDIVSLNPYVIGNVGIDFGGVITKLIPDEPEKIIDQFRTENNIAIKYSYGTALSQTASSIGTSEYTTKKGQDLSVEYGFRYSPEFEYAIGFRRDYDIYRLTTPVLDIPTERNFLTASFIYHFITFTKNKNNFYTAITFGVGNSSTTINNEVNSGISTLLPQVRLGYLYPFNQKVAMISELSFESIAGQEKLADGSKQNANQVNVKLSIGVRF